VSAAEGAQPVSAAEANKLFQPLAHASVLVLAVSGGADSTTLLVLAARWRRARKKGPKLLFATVDHGLRRESAAEARAVERLARRLGVPHRTLRWRGKKPTTGLQQAARNARYSLLGAFARRANADYILTAHTLDDQAETVLIRMSRGSGITGLCSMRDITPLSSALSQLTQRQPRSGGRPRRELSLMRPLLGISKARLIATLQKAGIAYVDDPTNRDPRFARSRLRALMPALAREGLDAGRLALLARRLQRAEGALETDVDVAMTSVSEGPWSGTGPVALEANKFFDLPPEIGVRLLSRAVAQTGSEGAPQLGKVETLYELLATAKKLGDLGLRRTLAGAMITLTKMRVAVERAPPRRSRDARRE
jgi:tRNA(Ile)-lysidine synthase